VTTYRVEVTDLAADSIEHYTQYIQQQSGSVEVGLRSGQSHVMWHKKHRYLHDEL